MSGRHLAGPGGAFGERIDVRPVFGPARASLLDLLAGLDERGWGAQAVPGWSVQDVVAHLLHDQLRRLSATRDGHHVPLPPGDSLADRLDRANEAFVDVARQLSPPLLMDLLGHLGPQLDAYWAGQDLDGPADVDVSWAGAGRAPLWLDLAREYTEHWVHEQQIRDAVSLPGSDTREVMGPVLDTFARALPFTLRAVDRPAGTRARLRVSGPSGGTWEVVRRDGRWILTRPDGEPAAEVVMDEDTFWRLAARRITVEAARARAQSRGDAELASATTRLLAVVR